MKKGRTRRVGSITLIAFLLAVPLCACRGSVTNSSKDSTVSSTTAAEESDTGTETSAINTDTTGSGTSMTGDGTTTGKNGTPGTATAKGQTTTTTKRQGEATSTASPVKHTLTLSLDQWHPGVAGYDAEYMIVPVMDDQLVGAKQMIYSNSTGGVKISGNTVTIPYSVRSKGQPVTITGKENSTGVTATVSIPCKTWTSSFGDEFDGTSLDSSKWGCHEEGTGDIALMYHENATVADGKLSLWVKKEQKTYNGRTYEYTQGSVSTYGKYTQKYGLFTCSMKIPKQSALNSAFWMFPGGAYGSTYHFYDKTQPSKGCSELDFVEISGYWGKKYCITEHFYDTADNKAHTSKYLYPELSVDPTENFVEYSCAWLEDGLYYYANGKLVWYDISVSPTGGSNGKKTGRPGRIIVSLGMYAPENTWCGPWQFKDSDFPISLEVDYVRAYQ